jgi:hypothetical protein
MTLKTEQHTEDMRIRILSAVEISPAFGLHSCLEPIFEHGQWWVTCLPCGAQWAVVDADGGTSVDGFDFEQVSCGESCCHCA